MQFTIFGDNSREGSYLLVIDVTEPLSIVFGRFLKGAPVAVPAGTLVYVGSALGRAGGAFPLASRLVRHAARSGSKPDHRVRRELLDHFSRRGYAPREPAPVKKLHWHIDYLLDHEETAITGIVMIQGPERIEHRLAGLIGSMPGSSTVADRLGAQDSPAGTHLFAIPDPCAMKGLLQASLPFPVTA
jgi:Uri superfamily endonuclease